MAQSTRKSQFLIEHNPNYELFSREIFFIDRYRWFPEEINKITIAKQLHSILLKNHTSIGNTTLTTESKISRLKYILDIRHPGKLTKQLLSNTIKKRKNPLIIFILNFVTSIDYSVFKSYVTKAKPRDKEIIIKLRNHMNKKELNNLSKHRAFNELFNCCKYTPVMESIYKITNNDKMDFVVADSYIMRDINIQQIKFLVKHNVKPDAILSDA